MDLLGNHTKTGLEGGIQGLVDALDVLAGDHELGALIDALNGQRNPPMQIDYSWDAAGHPANRYCRSDHFMYARYGIPITYFSLGYHPHYHMVTDEPQYIDYPHMARVDNFIEDLAVHVANLDHRVVVDKPKPDPRGACVQ